MCACMILGFMSHVCHLAPMCVPHILTALPSPLCRCSACVSRFRLYSCVPNLDQNVYTIWIKQGVGASALSPQAPSQHMWRSVGRTARSVSRVVFVMALGAVVASTVAFRRLLSR